MKRTLTILLVMLFAMNWVHAQLGDVLYDQSSGVTLTDPFTSTDNGTVNIQSADDFTIPAGESWEIGQLTAAFVSGSHTNFYVKIYDQTFDYSNYIYRPNTELFSAYVSATAGADLGGYYMYTIDLPNPVTLSGGNYFLSIVADDANGEWATYNATYAMFNQAAVIKDFNGAAIWETSWTSAETYFDLIFTVRGPKPRNNDLTVSTIVSPSIGDLTTEEEVSILIENKGLATQNSYSVYYQVSKTVDGELAEVKTCEAVNITEELVAGESFEYTFAETVDLSELIEYSISATVSLAADENTLNDKFTTLVQNIGPSIFMGQVKDTVTCGTKFYDDAGPFENYTSASKDTITFYPATEGARVSMDFVSLSLGSDFSGLSFYDGETTEAPLLVRLGYSSSMPNEAIIARNAAGAITVVADNNVSTTSYNAGWEIDVNCVMPNDTSFQLVGDVNYIEDAIIFNNKVFELEFYVANAGTKTLSREVYLLENDAVVDTLTTAELAVGGIDTLKINWVPSVFADSVNVKIKVQDDPQDTNDDNQSELVFTVYNELQLVESFENGLPWNWISTEGASECYNSTWNSTQGEYYLRNYGTIDTIIMPLVKPETGDKLIFDAFGSSTALLNVIYSTSLSGPWDTLAVVDRLGYSATTLEYALDDFTDSSYYFAYAVNCVESYNEVAIDFVRGAKLYYYERDLAIKELAAKYSTPVNKEMLFDVTVTNNGTEAISGKDYNVFVKDTSGNTLASALGATIESGATTVVKVPYTFTEIDTVYYYSEIVLNNEIRTDNNTSQVNSIIVVNDSTYIYELPYESFDEYNSYDFPIPASIRTGAVEMIIYPEELQQGGPLSSVEFMYTIGDDYENAPVTIYMAHVADSLLGYNEVLSWGNSFQPEWKALDSVEYSVVFDDSLDFYVGENYLKIDLENKFNYNGTDNLLIIIDKADTSTTAYGLQFKQVKPKYNTQYRYLTMSDYSGNEIDLNEPTQYPSSKDLMPYTRFYFTQEGTLEFESTPDTLVAQNAAYSYQVEANASYETELSIKPVTIPDWLTLTQVNDTLATLAGTTDSVGDYTVILETSDGNFSATQSYVISVKGMPEFAPAIDSVAVLNELYEYTVEVSYDDEGYVAISDTELPSWLTLTDNGDNTATLSGTPTVEGEYAIALKADGEYFSNTIEYSVYVGTLPVFAAVADTLIADAVAYTQNIDVTYNGTKELVIAAGDLFPSWITLTKNNDHTVTLSGTPTLDNLGTDTVQVVATDSIFTSVLTYYITVGSVPEFTLVADTVIAAGVSYNKGINVAYHGLKSLKVTAGEKFPSWLTILSINNSSMSLVGSPKVADIGVDTVQVIATDSLFTSVLTYVISIGDVPEFTSTPDTVVTEGEAYTYAITVDYEGSDVLKIQAGENMPAWLTLTDNGDGTAELSGTATEVATLSVEIEAVGEYFSTVQAYQLTVEKAISVQDDMAKLIALYPNPASSEVTITNVFGASLTLMDVSGKVINKIDASVDNLQLQVNQLEKGIYFILIEGNDYSVSKKLIVE